MSAEKLVEKRLQKFRQQLRAQQIQTIFQYYRQNLIKSRDPSNLNYTFCFPQNNAHLQSVTKALKQFKQVLILPFKNQMLDQNSSKAQISTEIHVKFWQQCLFWLQKNKPNQYAILPILKNFILQLKQNFSWQHTNISPNLLDLYMELIQKLYFQFQDQIKKSLAQWISDAKYLSLIQKLFTSTQEFPSPQQYSNIFQTITKALDSQIAQYNKNAAYFILQLAKYANPTQNFLIFKHQIQIFNRLYQLLDKNSNSIQAINYWPPIFYLLNNYSQAIEFSVDQGLINICYQLIKSNLEDNIFGALAILKVLSCGQDKVLAKIQQNLSSNKQNWLSISLDVNIFSHHKLDISKIFFQIIRNLIISSNKNSLILLNSIFQNKKKPIMGLISQVWQTSQKDQNTVNFTLQCVSAFLVWNQILLFDQHSAQVFLKTNNMIPFIKKCLMSQNQKISDIASSIIQQIESVEKMVDRQFV